MHIAIESKDGHDVPVLTGTGHAVAEIVTAVHDASIDEGLSRLGILELDRETLEPILIYCAERQCVGHRATCPGCSRRNEIDGSTTFDAFVARHKDIVTEAGGIHLTGSGMQSLKVSTLESLSRTWMGEELWFHARRVLRKLRYGVRATPAAEPNARPSAPSIILVEPQLADNIGMVGRAMANFGLSQLRLVKPRDGWPNEKARIAASGATFIIDEAECFPDFASALGDFNFVLATTARQRDLAKPVLTPEQAVAEMRRRIADGQRCAVVFGRERNGLETSEIANADAIVMAEVDPAFASLNLAQSVLLIAYEWMKQSGSGSLGRVTTYETAIQAGLHNRGFEQASKAELLGFFEHLERELDAMGFLQPVAKRPTMIQNLRSMFTRMAPTQQEVRTLRGIVKALAHGKGPGRKPQ